MLKINNWALGVEWRLEEKFPSWQWWLESSKKVCRRQTEAVMTRSRLERFVESLTHHNHPQIRQQTSHDRKVLPQGERRRVSGRFCIHKTSTTAPRGLSAETKSESSSSNRRFILRQLRCNYAVSREKKNMASSRFHWHSDRFLRALGQRTKRETTDNGRDKNVELPTSLSLYMLLIELYCELWDEH